MTTATVSSIAASFGVNEAELSRQARVSLLHETKRRVLQRWLEILARYESANIEELASKIARGEVVEHPGWEDLIVAETLMARLEELDSYLSDLQNSGN